MPWIRSLDRATHAIALAFALSIAASVLAGCGAVVVPPARISVLAGSATGGMHVTNVARGGVETTSSAPSVTLRASVQPFQVVNAAQNRRFDVGVGYGVDFVRSSATTTSVTHAPYIELSGYPAGGIVGMGQWRLGFHVSADAAIVDLTTNCPLCANPNQFLYGFGATASSTLEFFGFAALHGSGSDHDSKGAAAGAAAVYGETGVGVEAFTSVRSVDGQTYMLFGLGLSTRIPATAAAGVGAAAP